MSEDRTKTVEAWEKENVYVNLGDIIGDAMIYQNYSPERRTPPKSEDHMTKDQQQITSVSKGSEKKNLVRASAVFLGLLCLVLLAGVIVLGILLIQGQHNWVDNTTLIRERDALRTNYSEMKTLCQDLIQNVSQLEREKNLLEAMNINLTNERDELQQQIEKRRCPANWKKFEDSCYFISRSKKNWADSKKDCESYDAQLLIISSQMEQVVTTSFGLRTWIGLTDAKGTNKWKWVNGKPVTETYWAPGQPDNATISGEGERCAEIVGKTYSVHNWNDLTCNYESNFICEKMIQ